MTAELFCLKAPNELDGTWINMRAAVWMFTLYICASVIFHSVSWANGQSSFGESAIVLINYRRNEYAS